MKRRFSCVGGTVKPDNPPEQRVRGTLRVNRGSQRSQPREAQPEQHERPTGSKRRDPNRDHAQSPWDERLRHPWVRAYRYFNGDAGSVTEATAGKRLASNGGDGRHATNGGGKSRPAAGAEPGTEHAESPWDPRLRHPWVWAFRRAHGARAGTANRQAA